MLNLIADKLNFVYITTRCSCIFLKVLIKVKIGEEAGTTLYRSSFKNMQDLKV